MPDTDAIAQSMSPGDDAAAIAKQVAHAHLMFNCFGVLAALPFTTYMAKGMMRLIPDKAPVPVPVPATDLNPEVGSGGGH